MNCRKCGSEQIVKNGHHLRRRRFKCKECGFQFATGNVEGARLLR